MSRCSKTRTCESATTAKPPANSAPSSIQPRAHPAPTAPAESPAPKDRPRQSSLLHGRRTVQVVCSTPAATSSLRRVLRYYRRCAMQCPHHSNRLCPAYRSHPRPDHQPCPPPSPCESHPRHRAAPAVFQTSAASCGAKRFQHAGRVARTASQRAPRESNLIPAPVHGRGTQRRPSARPPRLPPRRAKRTLPSAAPPDAREDGSRCSRSVSCKGARRRALALPSLGREHAARFACPLARINCVNRPATPRRTEAFCRILPPNISSLPFPRRFRLCG